MIRVYLIRHGETHDNQAGIIPAPDSIVSPTGIKDVEVVAKSLIIPAPSILLSGDTIRAVTTATILNSRIAADHIHIDPRFNERRLPTSILGTSHADFETQNTFKSMEAHGHDMSWHEGDEENYLEFLSRVRDSLRFLEALPDNTTAVIATHAGFIKAVVALLSHQEQVSYESFAAVEARYSVKSAGALRLQHGPTWEIINQDQSEFLAPRASLLETIACKTSRSS